MLADPSIDAVCIASAGPGAGARALSAAGNSVAPRGVSLTKTDSGGRTLRWLYDSNGAHHARVDRFGHVFPPETELPILPNPFARELPSTWLGFTFADRIAPSPEALLGITPNSLPVLKSVTGTMRVVARFQARRCAALRF